MDEPGANFFNPNTRKQNNPEPGLASKDPQLEPSKKEKKQNHLLFISDAS